MDFSISICISLFLFLYLFRQSYMDFPISICISLFLQSRQGNHLPKAQRTQGFSAFAALKSYHKLIKNNNLIKIELQNLHQTSASKAWPLCFKLASSYARVILISIKFNRSSWVSYIVEAFESWKVLHEFKYGMCELSRLVARFCVQSEFSNFPS